jgi:hypothetical protein
VYARSLKPTSTSTPPHNSQSWLTRLKYDQRSDNEKFGAVVNVDRIRMAADVVPFFGEKAPRQFTLQNSAEAARFFNLNIFIDKESFFVLYPRKSVDE